VTNTPQWTDTLWGRGAACPFDDVIDVRSPGEYAEDHHPAAVNLPVLDDAERATVGTIYRQDGPFLARKVGAAHVSVNIAGHLRGHFADKGKDYRPLVYCWRGGQRSASLAVVLAHVGWRVTVLRGGYKTYRGHVRRELDAVPPLFAYRVIAGATGTGKTRLLHALAARGAQVLDLEGLARHRGSVLGGGGPQPSQKFFDSLLVAAFDRFDPAAPVWVEAESNRIGDVYLPTALWAMMRAADGVEVRVPVEGRVGHLLEEYRPLIADPDGLKEKLQRLAFCHGRRQIEAWCHLADSGEWAALVASLLAVHYDPAYTTSAGRCYPHVKRVVTMADTSAAEIDALAAALHPRTIAPNTSSSGTVANELA
jgi:tRNA 2-selenouridine synthase